MTQPNNYLDSINPYNPGKSSSDLGNKEFVKLSSNENPFGMGLSSEQFQSLCSNLERYPATNNNDLINKLSVYHSISPDQIILGNGSDELFQIISQAYLNPQTDSLSSKHTFSVYKHCTLLMGAVYKDVDMSQYGYDLDAMLSAISTQTRVIFIANPNNPTGSFLTVSQLDTFLSKLPSDIVVVLDEAYKDYVQVEDQSKTVDLLKTYKNLIITRTFSKLYGLAGFRLGYAMADSTIIALLKKIKPPFNVNSLALGAGTIALDNTSFFQHSYSSNQNGLKRIFESGPYQHLDILPSQANFVCILSSRFKSSFMFNYFLQHGYIIRDLASFGLPNGVRLTIGSPEDVARCVSILNSLDKESS